MLWTAGLLQHRVQWACVRSNSKPFRPWDAFVADSIRWFDKSERVGLLLNREEFAWILKLGGAEHVLHHQDLKVLLRSMRRMRDFEAGRQSRVKKEGM